MLVPVPCQSAGVLVPVRAVIRCVACQRGGASCAWCWKHAVQASPGEACSATALCEAEQCGMLAAHRSGFPPSCPLLDVTRGARGALVAALGPHPVQQLTECLARFCFPHTQEAHAARWVRRLDPVSGRAFGVGKRKTSVAQVWLKPGAGEAGGTAACCCIHVAAGAAHLRACWLHDAQAMAACWQPALSSVECQAAWRGSRMQRLLSRNAAAANPPLAAALSPPAGHLMVNKRPYDDYFPDMLRRNDLMAPFLGAPCCAAAS